MEVKQSPTDDQGTLLASLHGIKSGGTGDLLKCIKIAMVRAPAAVTDAEFAGVAARRLWYLAARFEAPQEQERIKAHHYLRGQSSGVPHPEIEEAGGQAEEEQRACACAGVSCWQRA